MITTLQPIAEPQRELLAQPGLVEDILRRCDRPESPSRPWPGTRATRLLRYDPDILPGCTVRETPGSSDWPRHRTAAITFSSRSRWLRRLGPAAYRFLTS
jgi:hypothetical protein